jgi:hypothetical protein
VILKGKLRNRIKTLDSLQSDLSGKIEQQTNEINKISKKYHFELKELYLTVLREGNDLIEKKHKLIEEAQIETNLQLTELDAQHEERVKENRLQSETIFQSEIEEEKTKAMVETEKSFAGEVNAFRERNRQLLMQIHKLKETNQLLVKESEDIFFEFRQQAKLEF